MKKTRLTVLSLIVIFLLFSLGNLFAQNNEDSKFQKLLENYLDEYWKFYPTAATLAGYYKYNDKLEDPSSGNVDRRDETLKKFNGDMIKIDRSKLSAENQQALNILFDQLDLEFVTLENTIPWEYNPLFYNEIIINSVQALLTKDFAPIDTRIKSATERVKLIPGLIKRAKSDLKTPAQAYTEAAIKQIGHIIDFYRNDVAGLIASASDANKQLFLAEVNRLIPVLEDYRQYLKSDLLPKSTGNFRLQDAHRRMIQRLSGAALSQEELISRATREVKDIRNEMLTVCYPLHKIMYPDVDIDKLQGEPDTLINRIVKDIFDKIKTFHPTAENFVPEVVASADRLKKFGQDTKLFPIPTENLNLKPMPPYFSGLSFTRLVGPGAYDNHGSYSLEIMSIPSDWSPEKIQGFLEEYNNFELEVMAAQYVFPGTFVPLVSTRKSGSLMTKLFPNMALTLGWPLYLEENLITSGYGDYDLRLRLAQLKMMLKNVMDFIIDLNIHQGTMTKDQVMRYLTVTGFQSEAEAERKWDYLVLNPGMGALPYIGLQEILDLEKDVQRTKGQAFNKAEFITKLISNSALPPSLLRNLVTQ
ncbi:MAG TPA: DUF885 domain-containing protein [Acidobacteria bacterium]|nr:DUF885 domain-containing protein [Acidobacteriota bacterium]